MTQPSASKSRAQSSAYDLAVVGAGIIGLATALAAVRRGLRVVVIDRDAQSNGASVRNFGFVTVTGQESGQLWDWARRSREVWQEVATAAGIPVTQRGLWMMVRRSESVRVLEAFMRTGMAAGCSLLSAAEARRRCPEVPAPKLAAVLQSALELRVESRNAIPRLAAWLEEAKGVTFVRNTRVLDIDVPAVRTSRGSLQAARVAVCPGDDFSGLFAQRLAGFGLTRCKLQMLRLGSPGFTLPATLMSDLGLARYQGYAALEAAAPLKARLLAEQPEHLQHGIHLIVVQSADGSLVVGDSHHYAPTPDPFGSAAVDDLILEEFRLTLGLEPPPVLERWTGTYASATDRGVLLDTPQPNVRLAIVTCGAGASTGFGIGEDLVTDLFGSGACA
jgi:D-hydroxyproline dehydrogenase subunit beta